MIALIAQSLAQFTDAACQDFVGDGSFPPDPLHKSIPLDNFTWPLRQAKQNFHYFGLNVFGAVGTFDQALEGMDDTFAQPEAVLELRVHCCAAGVLVLPTITLASA